MKKLASFTIVLDANLATCFKYLSDMEKFSSWFPGVLSIVGRSDEPICVGKQYIETVKIPLIGSKEITLTVQTFTKNALFVTEGDLSPLLPRMEIAFLNAGHNKTKVSWLFYSRNRNQLFNLILPIIKYVMRKRAKIAVVNLREKCLSF